jgi:UDPglucose 6-dehydrogenase
MMTFREPLSGAFEKRSNSESPLSGPLVGVNICVIGGGFVGLVSAAGFAQFGHKVICVEKDARRLEILQEGRLPFYEKGLDELIRSNVQCGRLSFSNDPEESIDGQNAVFVTVGTPQASTGRADLGIIYDVITTLSASLGDGQVVVLKSTVPVGTSSVVRSLIQQNGHAGRSIAVVNNPEFLREGTSVFDFFHPQRIVIGGDDPHAIELVKHIYRLGMTQPVPIVVTNNETAEIIKYASNAFLATKVGFINELACLCDRVGVNVLEVAHAMGLDPRIGSEFLSPGPGWGGSCFPKDLSEFVGLAETCGMPLLITKAVQEANQRQFELVVQKVGELVGDFKDRKIGILGLSFKAGTSDMRNSPSIPIIQLLLDGGAGIIAYDPASNDEASAIFPQIEIARNAQDVALDADCVVILTEWPEFQTLDWQKMAASMRNRNLVDTRNLLSPEVAEKFGLKYAGMGQV